MQIVMSTFGTTINEFVWYLSESSQNNKTVREFNPDFVHVLAVRFFPRVLSFSSSIKINISRFRLDQKSDDLGFAVVRHMS